MTIKNIVVVDTSVILNDGLANLSEISEHGCQVCIPRATYKEVKDDYLAKKNGHKAGSENHNNAPDFFKELLKQLRIGKFILVSTNGTGIVSQLQEKLAQEGIELKQPLEEGDKYEPPDINDIRVLAVAIYLKRKAEQEGECPEIYLLTHDRWLAQFAVRCGVAVLGVKVCNGWAKKQRIPWKRLLFEF